MKKLVLLIICLFSSPSTQSATATVNILAWFGYLRVPALNKLIEDKCQATLSIDEYYSNEEFLRRWKNARDDYDVIIFANLLYEGIKDNIELFDADLSEVTKLYYPAIKTHYDAGHYPKNIVYFSHSLMGFLWNPKVINLSENDDMFSVFKKAANNRVILIDDPVEVRNMIGLAKGQKEAALNQVNLKQLVQSSKVTLTNDYNKIYENPHFAFSYLWSGEAVINANKAGKPYQFLLHPKTSFICTDLLAQVKYNRAATCVSKVLASQQAMTLLQNANYYFSPYGTSGEAKDAMFKDIYQKAFKNLAKFTWIAPVSLEQFKQLEQDWKTLKLTISHR